MKKFLLKLFVFVLFVGTLTGCANQKAESTKEEKDTPVIRTVKISTLDILPAISLSKLYNELPKIKDGYTPDYSVAYNQNELLKSLLECKPDISIVTPEMAAKIYNENGRYKILGSLGDNPYYFVTDDKNVKSIDDLSGKTIYEVGTNEELETINNYCLVENGIDSNNVKINKIDVASYNNAKNEIENIIKNGGSINALISEPVLTCVLEKDKNVRIIKSVDDMWKGKNIDSNFYPGYTIIAKDDFIRANMDFVNSFLGQLSNSIDWSCKNPEIVKKYLNNMELPVKIDVNKNTMLRSKLKLRYASQIKSNYINYYKKMFNYNNKYKIPDEDIFYIFNKN